MDIFEVLLSQIHVLIGGRTGAGKSVLIAGILYTAMIHDPKKLRLILIDPKRVELATFRAAPHVDLYASEPPEMLRALQTCENIMDMRYQTMQAMGEKCSREPPIYIVIDELADLLDTCGKPALKTLKRILQLGRAAGIHVIAATQHISRATLPAALQVNFPAIVALPQRSAIESRQMIGTRGAESLEVGEAYIMTPENRQPRRVHIQRVSNADISDSLHLWDAAPDPEPETRKRGFFEKLIDCILFA